MLESSGRNRLVFTLLTLSSLVLSGCVTHHHHGSHRAPARDVVVTHHRHGDVYFHSGHHVTLVYDSGWGGYWVRELAHHYYRDGYYYRWHAKRWQRCRSPHGPWVVVATRSLPGGLHRHRARIERDEAKQAWNHSRFETRRSRRNDEREVREERREDRQEVREERREGRQDARHERREGRQDARHERRREDRQELREERHGDRQDARWERREESARTPQRAGTPREDEEQQPRTGHRSKRKRGAPIPADQDDDDS